MPYKRRRIKLLFPAVLFALLLLLTARAAAPSPTPHIECPAPFTKTPTPFPGLLKCVQFENHSEDYFKLPDTNIDAAQNEDDILIILGLTDSEKASVYQGLPPRIVNANNTDRALFSPAANWFKTVTYSRQAIRENLLNIVTKSSKRNGMRLDQQAVDRQLEGLLKQCQLIRYRYPRPYPQPPIDRTLCLLPRTRILFQSAWPALFATATDLAIILPDGAKRSKILYQAFHAARLELDRTLQRANIDCTSVKAIRTLAGDRKEQLTRDPKKQPGSDVLACLAWIRTATEELSRAKELEVSSPHSGRQHIDEDLLVRLLQRDRAIKAADRMEVQVKLTEADPSAGFRPWNHGSLTSSRDLDLVNVGCQKILHKRAEGDLRDQRHLESLQIGCLLEKIGRPSKSLGALDRSDLNIAIGIIENSPTNVASIVTNLCIQAHLIAEKSWLQPYARKDIEGLIKSAESLGELFPDKGYPYVWMASMAKSDEWQKLKSYCDELGLRLAADLDIERIRLKESDISDNNPKTRDRALTKEEVDSVISTCHKDGREQCAFEVGPDGYLEDLDVVTSIQWVSPYIYSVSWRKGVEDSKAENLNRPPKDDEILLTEQLANLQMTEKQIAQKQSRNLFPSFEKSEPSREIASTTPKKISNREESQKAPPTGDDKKNAPPQQESKRHFIERNKFIGCYGQFPICSAIFFGLGSSESNLPEFGNTSLTWSIAQPAIPLIPLTIGEAPANFVWPLELKLTFQAPTSLTWEGVGANDARLDVSTSARLDLVSDSQLELVSSRVFDNWNFLSTSHSISGADASQRSLLIQLQQETPIMAQSMLEPSVEFSPQGEISLDIPRPPPTPIRVRFRRVHWKKGQCSSWLIDFSCPSSDCKRKKDLYLVQSIKETVDYESTWRVDPRLKNNLDYYVQDKGDRKWVVIKLLRHQMGKTNKLAAIDVCWSASH